MGVKFLAIIGEEAAIKEAQHLCPNVFGVPVKSLERNWFPTAKENYQLIKGTVLQSLEQREHADVFSLSPPYKFSMKPTPGYYYDPNSFSKMSGIMFYLFTRLYRGNMNPNEAWWETNTINKGLYALEFARQFMKVEK
jgi:hypothetical protein